MLVSILAALFGAALVPWGARRYGERVLAWSALIPAGIALWSLVHLSEIAHGRVLSESMQWLPELGIRLSFRMDGLGWLFFFLISGIGALIILYSAGYLHGHRHQARFVSFTFLFMASMLGVVTADNLVVLFVFWELTSFTSYLLIGFEHHRDAARKAALQALLVTGVGGLFMLAGLLLMGQVGGSMNLSDLLAGDAAAVTGHRFYPAILALVLIGCFTKSAQWPFHFWLPNAMQAPSPASAYLHSSTMVKAGVYLLARLSPVLGGTAAWNGWLVGIGTLTVLTAGVMAVGQRPIKRLLAYSTVAALGFLVACIGIGTKMALVAMAAFLLAHALYKAGLFLVAGIIDHETGERDVEKLSGLGRAMPWTALAAGIAALSMAGLPPLCGFVGKEAVYAATRGHLVLPVLFLLGNAAFVVVAVLTGWRIFRGRLAETPHTPHDPPASMLAGPLVLAALTLLCGLFIGAVGHYVVVPAASAVAGSPLDKHLALWHGVNRELLLSLATLAAGLVLYRRRSALLATGERMAGWAAWGPDRWYERKLDWLNRIAAWQTRLLQSGYLRRYLRIIIVTTIALCGWAALRLDPGPELLDVSLSPVFLTDAVIALLIIGATAGAVHSPSRLGAIASLGVVGYGVALLFVFYGAPDLAMTQLVIETLTVILLVLAFYHLPSFSRRSPQLSRARDTAISLAAGGLMSVLVFLALTAGDGGHLAEYYAAKSWTEAHGRNIVNVILVDFRALDTLGEITVLAVAAVGAAALLKLRPGKGGDSA